MTTLPVTTGRHRFLSPAWYQQRKQWLDLVALLVQRDLRVRYRGSILGYFWSMLNPLLYMVILSFVFSHVVKVKTDSYALFILAGIMAWNLFQQSIAIGMNSIVGSGHLLKKVNIPTFLFPSASIAGVLVNFSMSFIPFFILSAFLGARPSLSLLLLPFFVLPYIVFIWGIVLALASINVKFRDVGHAMEPLLQILFYASPVVYPTDIIPERWRFLVELNPMTHFIGVFRGIMLGQVDVPLRSWAVLVSCALLSAAVGIFTYRIRRAEFIYNL